jgi:hypothetical protein
LSPGAPGTATCRLFLHSNNLDLVDETSGALHNHWFGGRRATVADTPGWLPAGWTEQLQTAADRLKSVAASGLPEGAVDGVSQLGVALEEQVRRLGQSLREEGQSLREEMVRAQEEYRRQMQRQFELERRHLRAQAFWQWVITAAAVVAAVVGWLCKS